MNFSFLFAALDSVVCATDKNRSKYEVSEGKIFLILMAHTVHSWLYGNLTNLRLGFRLGIKAILRRLA